MFNERTWPELRADLVEAQGGLEGPTEWMVYEAVNAVDSHIAQFIQACECAEEEVARAREGVERLRDGVYASVGANTLGILQSRNGEMDRHVALLEAALQNARRVARAVGVNAHDEVPA